MTSLPEKSREVRLGLVMYGGVSLAIYINGVAHEFFRAVRGRGVYRLVKALTDSDIVVDVVSGTSAGGINGIFLSYALCNDLDFSSCARLWRRDGDIRRLLRAVDDTSQCHSLLDSEAYYHPALVSAFEHMPGYVPEPGEDASLPSELDLYVTSTDVDGRIFTEVDDAGHLVDVKEHRTVFYLKYRQGRANTNDFAPGRNPAATYDALAKLSRATSCFPAAFAPVRVRHEPESGGTADGKLQRWGRLGRDALFLDGGVLDNKPFTHTLNAIFRRTADREVSRRLFYVEPDPEQFQRRAAAPDPNILQIVFKALLGIPGYESIASDLQALAKHNSAVRQYQRVTEAVHQVVRVQDGVLQRAPEAVANRDGADWRIYQRCRRIALCDRVVQGILRTEGRGSYVEGDADRERASALMRAFDDFDADAQGKLLRPLDIYFNMRRVERVIEVLYDVLFRCGARLEPEERARYRATMRAFNRQIKLYTVVRTAMERLVDEAEIDWKQWDPNTSAGHLWERVELAYRHLLAVEQLAELPAGYEEGDGWLAPDRLDALKTALAARAARIKREISTGTDTVSPQELDAARTSWTGVLDRAAAWEREILQRHCVETGGELDHGNPVVRAYLDFEAVDAQVYPIELVSGLREKNIIRIVRISPRDARLGFSDQGFSDKVAGDALHHFGGFFKRSWRSNDILWGRIDGVSQLVESLLELDRVKALVGSAEGRARLRERFFGGSAAGPADALDPALDPAQLFPQSGEVVQGRLRAWLRALLGEADEARAEALAAWNAHLLLLVEAAQLELIAEELPNVATDAVEEQAEWNQYAVRDETVVRAGSRDDAPVLFEPASPSVDPFVAAVAAAERTRTGIQRLRDAQLDNHVEQPSKSSLGRFFRSSYRVGAESLMRDIPSIILLDVLSSALLVARNCLLHAFGPEAVRIRRNPLFKLTLDWPLRILHLLARYLRSARRPARRAVQVAVASGLAAAALWYVRAYPPTELNALIRGMLASGMWLGALTWAVALCVAYYLPNAERRRRTAWERFTAYAPLPGEGNGLEVRLDGEYRVERGERRLWARRSEGWLSWIPRRVGERYGVIRVRLSGGIVEPVLAGSRDARVRLVGGGLTIGLVRERACARASEARSVEGAAPLDRRSDQFGAEMPARPGKHGALIFDRKETVVGMSRLQHPTNEDVAELGLAGFRIAVLVKAHATTAPADPDAEHPGRWQRLKSRARRLLGFAPPVPAGATVLEAQAYGPPLSATAPAAWVADVRRANAAPGVGGGALPTARDGARSAAGHA